MSDINFNKFAAKSAMFYLELELHMSNRIASDSLSKLFTLEYSSTKL